MEAHRIERKLAAILSADVKGYSRLMGEDEEATLRTLTAYRQVVDTAIEQYRGRIVGTAGDSVLAEFASMVDAVECAVTIQTRLRRENASLSPDKRMEFRIGINLGDVMVQGEQIYGDGVNIAARLEALADPGGICISGTVYDQIKNKLVLEYEYQGEQTVKNIAEPVRVYRIVMEIPSPLAGEGQGEGAFGRTGAAQTPHPNLPPQGGKESKTRRVATAYLSRATLIVIGLLIVGGIITLLYPSLSPFRTPHSALKRRCRCPTSPPSPCCRSPTSVATPSRSISAMA